MEAQKIKFFGWNYAFKKYSFDPFSKKFSG